MKIKKSEINEMIDNKINQLNDILYIGIELADTSKKRLIEFTKSKLNDIWVDNDVKIYCDHTTLAFGKDVQNIIDFALEHEGENVPMRVISFGYSDKAMAVKVVYSDSIPYMNKLKHITLSVNQTNNGKPVDSNYIQSMENISEIGLLGHIKIYRKSRR